MAKLMKNSIYNNNSARVCSYPDQKTREVRFNEPPLTPCILIASFEFFLMAHYKKYR